VLRKLRSDAANWKVDVANLVVTEGLIANKDTTKPQLIQVSLSIDDINSGAPAQLQWHNVGPDGNVHEEESFATAELYFGTAAEWLSSWTPTTHLVLGRIQALQDLAERGVANKFSNAMAYRLFGNSLVDYAPKYRGMQSVVLHGLEAFADVELGADRSGSWTVPPHWIDSVGHLAGFVMNVSDAVDNQAKFCVTPGCRSMRFAKDLVAGGKYRSYVKMIPTDEDPNIFLGDVYCLQGDEIIGMVEGIKFRAYPRVLMNRFFTPRDVAAKGANTNSPVAVAAHAAPKKTVNGDAPTKPFRPLTNGVATEPTSRTPAAPAHTEKPHVAVAPEPAKAPAPAPVSVNGNASSAAPDLGSDSIAAKAVALLAREAALDPSELHDDASFANLGVDSLMSLVLAEKFRDDLGVVINGSLFLEYPTVGDLRRWLVEYYS